MNFVDGGESRLIFTGSEGTMEIGCNTLSLSRTPREKEPDYTVGTFTEAMQKSIVASYPQKYPASHSSEPPSVAYEKYVAPAG